jgi:AraC-like DNA-binding protein
MSIAASRARIERAEDGSWELVRAEPAPELRAYVHGYDGFVERSARPLRRRELPGGRVPLILNFGAPYEVGVPGGAAEVHAGSFVARVSTLPAVTAFEGTAAGIQVDLTPLGAFMFFAVPMHELPEPAARLDELLGPESRRLTERLRDAPGWDARFELLDGALARRFATAPLPAPYVEWAWDALRRSAGRAEIGALAARLSCSPRHLIQGFREQVGVAPKTAARILRLERAAALLRVGGDVPLARVASECGYADQAHMTRDFRGLARMTPAAYAAAWRPGFLGVPEDEDEVNFVQDRAVTAA